jgi:hypothetical protein
MKISNIICTTAATNKSSYCQKKEKKKWQGERREGMGRRRRTRGPCDWYIKFAIIKWSVL